ncbi:AsmA family protein [Hwanghaeella sp.]|uniref:AsmA family protein n=1 Tax=Hwanghaeella sp. TaxID=2605943 RepID=UPI003CCB9580
MKWLGIGAGLVLACIVGTAVLLPRVIDWQSYRPEIAALAEEAIGRPVLIDGNIRAELFPTPQLTAGGIRVLTQDGSSDLAAVRWAEARFKFSDLLRGDVTLTSLALVEPVVTLSAGLIQQLQTAPTDAGVPEARGASLTGGDRREARLVEIRNGTIRFAEADETAFRVEGVTGRVETTPVGRRILVSLTGRYRQRDLDLDMRVAPPQEGEGAPITLTLTDKADKGVLRLGGEWRVVSGAVSANGDFAAQGPNLAAISAFMPMPLPPEIAAIGSAFRVDGQFDVDGAASSLQLTGISANTDRLSASGQASALWTGRPKVDLALRVGRLDLDGLKAAAPEVGGTATTPAGETSAAPGLPITQAEGQDLMAWIGGLPADVALDLSVAGARFRDTVVRRITVRGTVDRGTVTLEELSAQLPGGTDLSIAGFGDMTGPEPLLEGNATLRADDLRRFLNWAGLPVPDVSADRLRRFSMVSGISLRPRRLDIIDASVEFDGVTATAAAAVALRRRMGLGIRMTLDHINLDAYRPVYISPVPDPSSEQRGTQASAGTSGGSDAGTGIEGDSNGDIADLWSRFDASLDLRIGRAVGYGVPFNDVAGNLVLKDGVLTVNEMTFRDAGGVSGQVGGQFSLDGDRDATVFAFEGKTEDLGRLSALLEGPDFLSALLRSMGPTVLKASYQPALGGPPLVLQSLGTEGGFSFGAALMQGEAGEPAVDLVTGEIEAYGIALTGLAGRMVFPAGDYQVEKLSGTLNGGTLNVSGGLRRREDGLLQLLVTGALDDMVVDRQLADLDGPIALGGKVSVRGQAEATGSDWRAMAALNSGWFDLDGSVSLDIGPSRSNIVKVRQVSDVRAALRDQFSSPASLQGTLALENGVLQSRDIALRGNKGGVLGLTGRLGLGDLQLSAELVLRKGRDAPQFARLIAEGPARTPNLRLEGAGPSVE